MEIRQLQSLRILSNKDNIAKINFLPYSSGMKNLISIILSLFLSIQLFSQIGSTIPKDRKVEWQYAGYMHNDVEIPTEYDYTVTVKGYNNTAIEKALSDAVEHNRRNPEHLTRIYFPPGIYNITKSIELNSTHNNIVLAGAKAGSDPETCTILKFDGKIPYKDYPVIQLKGSASNKTYSIVKYDSGNKKIYLNIPANEIASGDFVEIEIPNGEWQDTYNDKVNNWNRVPKFYVGQIVKVISSSNHKKELALKDEIGLIYSFAVQNNPRLTATVRMISNRVDNIGIESFTIESGEKYTSDEPCGKRTAHINMEYATNCWVKLIGSINPGTNHVHISKSAFIEVRDSYFRGAHYHGGCGNAYGVMLWKHPTYCLIENNVFRDLRHSILLQLGANHNVIGYNYSREQHDLLNLSKEDISLHGHFAYANLFEGNYVDRMGIDLYWGKSGPYNTFFRNYSKDRILKMEWERNVYDPDTRKIHHKIIGDNRFNILGNEAKVYTTVNNRTDVVQKEAPSDALDIYGFNDYSGNKIFSHSLYTNDSYTQKYLPDISYYYKEKPGFLKGFSWPPIGPPAELGGELTDQNIPARKEFCSWPGSVCDE